eukprot:4300502-Alexandrium_andersonii.AAC.1
MQASSHEKTTPLGGNFQTRFANLPEDVELLELCGGAGAVRLALHQLVGRQPGSDSWSVGH